MENRGQETLANEVNPLKIQDNKNLKAVSFHLESQPCSVNKMVDLGLGELDSSPTTAIAEMWRVTSFQFTANKLGATRTTLTVVAKI